MRAYIEAELVTIDITAQYANVENRTCVPLISRNGVIQWVLDQATKGDEQ